jgi:hypothetical protein
MSVMWRRSWLALALVACGGGDEARPHTPRPAPLHVVVAPHSGEIVMVAITEDVGAALSVDDLDQVRLWPALDGTREPVVVEYGPVSHVALARDGRTLIAALVDQAGGGELIAFDAEGRLEHRVQLGGEPAIEQVVGFDGGILVRRRDQSLDWIDGRGTSRGHLVAGDGERILGLAVRTHAVLALIGNAEPDSSSVRWIATGERLAWGNTIALPREVTAIALAPGHQQVAAIDARSQLPVIFGLAQRTEKLVGGRLVKSPQLGFIDDHHLAMAGDSKLEWWSEPAGDPWAGNGTLVLGVANAMDVGDGAVVAGHGGNLAIAGAKQVHYLGYAVAGLGSLTMTATQAALSINGHMLWLDGQLRATRLSTLEDERDPPMLALDDHRMLAATTERGVQKQFHIILRDVVSHASRDLGGWPDVRSATFEPRSGVIAIAMNASTERVSLDREHLSTTRLRALASRPNATVQPIDPRASGGIVAVTETPVAAGLVVETFRDAPGGHAGACPPGHCTELGSGPIPAAAVVTVTGIALGVDRQGRAYFFHRDGDKTSILVTHDARAVPAFELPESLVVTGGTVSPDGTQLALILGNEILAVDAHGRELWRAMQWRSNVLTYGADGKTLLVTTEGGLVELDAATGHQLANGCGWGFGLFDSDRTSQGRFGSANACAGAP